MDRIRRQVGASLRLSLINSALVLVLFVVVTGLDHRNNLRQWKGDLTSCRVSQAGRLDVLDRERDIYDSAADQQEFALRAADARHTDGDHKVARSYERIARHAAQRAHRSEARFERTRERLKQGDCETLYPKPTLNPLGVF